MPQTAATLLRRGTDFTGPSLSLVAPERLRCGRVHEFCGFARRTLAIWMAAQTEGEILWISPAWNVDRLHAEGVADWLNPARIIFVNPIRPEDILWTMEETLRSGAVRLAVADLPGPPGLTPIRRMHLAAETGGKEGPHMPLGILLTPDRGGAQGVESRWHLASDQAQQNNQWRLTRLRARTAPHATWTVREDPETRDRHLIKRA